MITPFIVQNAVKTIRRDDLGLVLNQLGSTGAGVDGGTYRGDYSVQILTKWTGKKLYSLDCWEEQNQAVYSDKVPSQEQQQNYQMTVAKLAAFGPRSQIIKGFSVPVAETFNDRSLDFAYLDANPTVIGLRSMILRLGDQKLGTAGCSVATITPQTIRA